MKMTQEQQIRHYRKMIQELSEENEKLKEQIRQYEEKGVAELVAETRKAKDLYESELKKMRPCMEEWKSICRKQRMRRRGTS